MSLCNTFRLFAVSVALVVSINTTYAFSYRRTTTLRGTRDLLADETRVISVQDNLRRPNLNRPLNAYNLRLTTFPSVDEHVRTGRQTISNPKNKTSSKYSKTSIQNDNTNTTKISYTNITKIPKKKSVQYMVTTPKPTTAAKTTVDENINSKLLNSSADNSTNIVNNKKNSYLKISTHIESDQIKSINDLAKSGTSAPTTDGSSSTEIIERPSKTSLYNKAYDATFPAWKKYTFINRNRLPVEDTDKKTINEDLVLIAPEIAQSASSLQDTITSDIPSLERLKNDLLSTATHHEQNNTKTNKILTQEINTHSKQGTVESKRAGFLDFSEKNKDVSTTYNISLEDATKTKQESPSHQMKDSAKEKQSSENDNKGQKERIDKEFEPSISQESPNADKQINEDKSKNVDKSKNASLYTVSPNYKPLKKLEVQPPKQFIRDPDDNSWRNESISSLGIVFKPKNSSKPFTQVLKNKTETEWNSLLEKEQKNDIPDLRERLEQMTKMRKTKRKKIDSMGNVVYVDYEENSNSNENSSSNENSNSNESVSPIRGDIMIPILSFEPPFLLTSSKFPITMSSQEPEANIYTTTPEIYNNKQTKLVRTRKPKKNFEIPDYYESSEDEDLDYLNLAKIDLKKYSTQRTTQTPVVPSTWPSINYKTTESDVPDRKATLQYFPPLTTKRPDLIRYNNLKFRDDTITTSRPTTNVVPVSYPESSFPANNKFSQYNAGDYDESQVTNKPTTIDTDVYLNQPPDIDGYKVISDNGGLNRGSYVIKSYADFINEADKGEDYNRNVEYGPYTEASVQSVTANEVVKDDRTREKINFSEDFDYDAKFRKDVLSRFVENFNRNSERFKSGFPIIFNSSIVHQSHGDGGEVASSRAFLRGLHGVATVPIHDNRYKQYDPSRENVTVELSPAYELHFYVPDEEEKEEAQPPVTLPLRYKL